ncbi:Signal transduction histidine kinase [Cupriavidus gilardii CR3]|uniref:ATP-binding sensor histidine kinase n=1 Tax=Cupriavidus gilardii TaxID=82541 RepID=UPI0006B2ECA9|nr:AAA family ATPase [Cupriavidus gilardii]ALD93011.1 Signal transduction histidine kinase [Cupriavidus gilardii CR3]MCT9012913.1 AAA family ATPase [Cupriavidus gilardii]MCT9052467.1 AAA family ATPase [Cupriavidus gilardii]WNG68186.1 AAA family ATPase [Cupriavidus gilardii]
MTSPNRPERHSPIAFDAAWLAATTAHLLSAADGVVAERLFDPRTGTYWLSRSASLASDGAHRQLQNELRLAPRLHPGWATVPIATVWTADRMVLLSEAHPSSRTAAAQIGPVLPIAAVFQIAIAAARALAAMHGKGLLHGDIRPHNLLIDDSGALRLTGFGHAVPVDSGGQWASLTVPQPAQQPASQPAPQPIPQPIPQPGAAALPYLAPELARGDVARIGVRSDLYALGVALYELLIGATPFQAESPAAWHHAHLAVEPVPPQFRRHDVPGMLGRIVLKLLAKDPADRYASAASLVSDLLRLRTEWESTGRIAPFQPDAAVRPPIPMLPGQLFGRDTEKAMLSEAWSRVRDTGRSELVLIAGAAGSGKSALVDWLRREAGLDALHFAGGKSDQLQRETPYAPVVQALRASTMALLGEDEAVLAPLRQRWLDGLAGQGRAVVELVPEAEHVIGATAPLSEVPAAQARARVDTAMLRTFAAFGEAGTPLVLFIDDLQWADASTLGLLEAFIAQPPDNVLLIGAYRDSRAGQEPGAGAIERLAGLAQPARPGMTAAAPATPISDTTTAATSAPMAVSRIQIKPLALAELTELVAAALDEAPARVAELARAVRAKTAGNPFFTYQLLRTLIDEGVLAYDGAASLWQWNAADLVRLRYTDSVIDLMVRRFARLPTAGTLLLQQLACVGIRCGEGLLARIAGICPLQIGQRLRPFVDAGLLDRLPEGYAFRHDRVLESAYTMIAPDRRSAMHAHIAASMIEHWQDELPDYAFEICNQIERAGDHPLTGQQRAAFVHVAIVAGRRAKRAAAIEQAARYTDAAFRLMPASWRSPQDRLHDGPQDGPPEGPHDAPHARPDDGSPYALAYAASVLRCECLLAQADLDGARREIDALLMRELRPIDRAAVHRLEAILLTVRCDYEGAINAALSGLALLDVRLQRDPARIHHRAAYEAVTAALGDRAIADLGALPATGDPRIRTAMGLLSTLISSLFVSDGISFLHVAKMVELTLEHGATPESAYGLSWFGVFVASLYDEYDDGLAYGLAALALIDRHGYEAERIATLVALDQVSAWTRPLPYALEHAQRAVALGRASGDIGMACYACNHIASDLLAMGEHLRLVKEEIERGLELTRLVQYRDIELILHAQSHFAQRLCAGDDAMAQDGPMPAAQTSVKERLRLSNSLPTRFWIWLYDGMAAAYLHDWEHASRSLAQAETLIWSAPAHINVADCRLFLALSFARGPAAALDRDQAITALQNHRERFAQWASLNALTFQSKLSLLDGEIARLRGDPLAALVCYERAAHAAQAAGFVHEQALANELAAMLCENHGLHTAARQHYRGAQDCYRRWGADHKAALLAARHPELGAWSDAQASPVARSGAALPAATRSLGIEAAQALSGEVVMDRLIETLMTNVVVHAGAQYGVLLLMHGDRPMIEATARVADGRVAVTLGTAAPTQWALPLTVLNTVLRTQRTLALADAAVEAPSIRERAGTVGPLRSVLCVPLIRGGGLIGAFYLENNLSPGVFHADCIAELEVLAPQVAISLETARLYEQLLDENTRRLTAEMNLRTARAELARTSHLTVMGSLAASIAHEVNQPLTAIVASVDASLRWLNRPAPELGEVAEGLAQIKQNGLRAADIIRALRSLAKQAPAVLAPLRPDDVVSEVLDMVRMDIEEHDVRVHVRLEAGAATVEGDRVQLQQVVLNLITNALDAMDGTPAERRELIVTSRREPGRQGQQEQVVVSVQDRGEGIAADASERIFDPFFTTKASGMGMGLAICRSIVEAHGGTLQARRPEQGGSEFEFRLPVVAG